MNDAKSQLYDLADQLYAMAPWKWLNEEQLVALRHPETGQIDHISIMGQRGEHVCLALYLGPQARRRFNLIHWAEESGIPLSESDTLALILESPQLQVAFSKRDELHKSELAEIKRLGRRYRGSNWPTFRAIRPGRAPAPIDDEEELAWLATAIIQCMETAPLLEDDPFATYRSSGDGSPPEIMTRELGKDGWHTTWTPDDEALFEFPTPEPDSFLAKKVSAYPKIEQAACLFELVPNPVGRTRKEAVYPYFLLNMAPDQGILLGADILSVENQSHEEMIASAPDMLLRQFDLHNACPASIYVASQTAHALLSKTAEALGASLHLVPSIPPLEDAFDSVVGSMFGMR